MKKVKEWLSATGFTNIGWGIGFVAGIILGWDILAGASLGVFACHNFVVIKNLIKGIK